MARAQVGERVGAIIGRMQDGTVGMAGYGVYESADEIPPVPVGLMRTAGDTWDEVDAYYRTELGMEDGFRGNPNPKLRMDDGTVVWGAEVWWGPESAVKRQVEAWEAAGETVQMVDVAAHRREAGYEMP
jgi:hypothetical protein